MSVLCFHRLSIRLLLIGLHILLHGTSFQLVRDLFAKYLEAVHRGVSVEGMGGLIVDQIIA